MLRVAFFNLSDTKKHVISFAVFVAFRSLAWARNPYKFSDLVSNAKGRVGDVPDSP